MKEQVHFYIKISHLFFVFNKEAIIKWGKNQFPGKLFLSELGMVNIWNQVGVSIENLK